MKPQHEHGARDTDGHSTSISHGDPGMPPEDAASKSLIGMNSVTIPGPFPRVPACTSFWGCPERPCHLAPAGRDLSRLPTGLPLRAQTPQSSGRRGSIACQASASKSCAVRAPTCEVRHLSKKHLEKISFLPTFIVSEPQNQELLQC